MEQSGITIRLTVRTLVIVGCLLVGGILLWITFGARLHGLTTGQAAPPVPAAAVFAVPTTSAMVDLSTLIVQPGDLPVGVTANAPDTKVWSSIADITTPTRFIHQEFNVQPNDHMGVTVLLYTSAADRIRAYSFILDQFTADTQQIGNIGQQALLETFYFRTDGQGMPRAAEIVFQRCNAIAYIRMLSAKNEDDIKAYAKRLDQRLTSAVC